MARKLRIQYPGAISHVMNRGDHSEDIFGTWLTYSARPGAAAHHRRNRPWGYEEFAHIIIG